uniref:Uncharacterized protein n=1 Tax=Schistocephalus solidus TaxID=70667 RepID=A0A0X3NPB6_SCHSO
MIHPERENKKIREYMSYKRGLPDYRPVERHCLYGMDADLIFLGLATHEPNMCILRENVFTAKSAKASDMPFCLVHLSLLREYIELEFKDLEKAISFKYNLERIIDDWIFLAYLLGNDFIPHLPNMHIHAESLTILWDTYHVVLPKLDGYLHDFGQLNLDRLHVFLEELSQFDLEWFEEREADQRWMKGKHGERMARELESLSRFESDARHQSATGKPSPAPILNSKGVVKPRLGFPKDAGLSAAAATAVVNVDNTQDAHDEMEKDDKSPENHLAKTLKRVLKLDTGGSEVENVATDSLEPCLADIFGDEPASEPPDTLQQANEFRANRPNSKHSREAINSSVAVDGQAIERAGSDNCFNGLLIYERTELGTEVVFEAEAEEEADYSDANVNNDSADEAELCDYDSEELDEDMMAYRMHRKDYYLSKLNIDIRGNSATRRRGASVSEGEPTEESDEARLSRVLMPLCSAYIRTLQWILHYYFTSVVDWSFYYPYHYAPFATDLLLFTKRFISGAPDHGREWTNFRLDSKPMLPFEQQMFIMPPSSASIVPEPYRWLLSSHDTPVSEFFPSDFHTDLNGKIASWEAVVLIPFIDEERMLSALAPCTARLSASDAARNCHRGNCFFAARAPLTSAEAERATFESLLTEEVDGGLYRANVLRDYQHCTRVYCSLPRPVEIHFPSLSRLPFSFEIKRIGVQTFSFPSKLESVVITVEHPLCRNALQSGISRDLSLRSIAHRYLGRVASVGWPYSRMVLPIIILDEKEIFELDTNSLMSGGKPVIHDSSHLRTMNPNSNDSRVPSWANLSWLQTHAEWATNRLKDRCAILLPSYPRAALLCRQLKSITLVARLKPQQGNQCRLQLNPLFTKADLHQDGVQQPARGRRNERGGTAGRTCLRTDANVSIALGDGLSLELLDLSLEDSGFSKECALKDLFQIGDRVITFSKSHFGWLAEITDWTSSGNLKLNAEPKAPLAGYPPQFREIICEADEQDYLTNRELADRLHLQPHIVAYLTDDVMIRAPHFENDKESSRRVINVGLALRSNYSRASIIGWSKFSTTRGMWLFSQRVFLVLRKYTENFPEMTNYLAGWNCRGVADIHHIFTQDTFASFRKLKDFLRTEVWTQKVVSTADAEWVEQNGFKIIESSLPVISTEVAGAKSEPILIRASNVVAHLPSGDVLVPDQYLDWLKTVKKKLYVFHLLDRVIYVGPSGELFGHFGVIVGCYSVNGEERLEVLFDKSFLGAKSIRGSPCRCAVVPRRHLLHYPTQQEPVQTTTSSALPQNLQPATAGPLFTTVSPPSPESLRHLYADLPPEWIKAALPAFSTAPLVSNPWPKPDTHSTSRKTTKHDTPADTTTALHHSASDHTALSSTSIPNYASDRTLLPSTTIPHSASDRTVLPSTSINLSDPDQMIAPPMAVPSSILDQSFAPQPSAAVTSQPPTLLPPPNFAPFSPPWPDAQSPTCMNPSAPPCLPPQTWQEAAPSANPPQTSWSTLRQEAFPPEMFSASASQLPSEGYCGSLNCNNDNNNLCDLQHQLQYLQQWQQIHPQQQQLQQHLQQRQQWSFPLPQQSPFSFGHPGVLDYSYEQAFAAAQQAPPPPPSLLPPSDFIRPPQPYMPSFGQNVRFPPPLMNFNPTQVLPPSAFSPDFQSYPSQAPHYP